MKKFIAALFLFASATWVNAQDFKLSLGFRFASSDYDSYGVAYKFFVSKPGAIEVDLGFGTHKESYYGHGHKHKWNNVSLSGAYQHHFPIGNVKNFKWFVGGGLVLVNSDSNHGHHGHAHDDEGFGVGIFPNGGVEYRLKKAPFVFSADLRPTFYVAEPHDYFNDSYVNVGVTARYVF